METRHLDTAFTVAKYNERLSTRHREGGGKAAAIMSVLGGQVWQRLFDRGGGGGGAPTMNSWTERKLLHGLVTPPDTYTHTQTLPGPLTVIGLSGHTFLFRQREVSGPPLVYLCTVCLEERRVRSLLKVRSRRKYRAVVMATNPRLLSRTWRKELPRENTVESLDLFVDGLVMNLSMILSLTQWPVVCMFRGKKSHKTKEPFE